ncbi:MAG: DUF4738 domain-containing protein [Prevotella sp.]|nr:DUF4738 domain-containing protein [Prevotella sp.]
MKKIQIVLGLVVLAMMLAACSEKKKSNDIIAPRIVKPELKEPIRMQEYTDSRDVEWMGKDYHVTIVRQPLDSLPKVKDENGQEFVDNVFRVVVARGDGSVFFDRTFTKSSVASLLDNHYRNAGVFEGLVFDRVEGNNLIFAASVGLPQTDEYIPMIISLSRTGELQMVRDSEMDTSGKNPQTTAPSEDI